MQEQGTIVCKKGDNKAFKMGEVWYNVNAPVVPYLEKLNKGDKVVVDFEKKGVTRYVSKIVKAQATKKEEVQEEVTESSTGFACKVCGKELKDDKYETCWTCNKKGLKSKEETKSTKVYDSTSKIGYGSSEDIAGKEIGCAVGAASHAAAGQNFADPETAAEWIKIVANSLLEWIRANK